MLARVFGKKNTFQHNKTIVNLSFILSGATIYLCKNKATDGKTYSKQPLEKQTIEDKLQ